MISRSALRLSLTRTAAPAAALVQKVSIHTHAMLLRAPAPAARPPCRARGPCAVRASAAVAFVAPAPVSAFTLKDGRKVEEYATTADASAAVAAAFLKAYNEARPAAGAGGRTGAGGRAPPGDGQSQRPPPPSCVLRSPASYCAGCPEEGPHLYSHPERCAPRPVRRRDRGVPRVARTPSSLSSHSITAKRGRLRRVGARSPDASPGPGSVVKALGSLRTTQGIDWSKVRLRRPARPAPPTPRASHPRRAAGACVVHERARRREDVQWGQGTLPPTLACCLFSASSFSC